MVVMNSIEGSNIMQNLIFVASDIKVTFKYFLLINHFCQLSNTKEEPLFLSTTLSLLN